MHAEFGAFVFDSEARTLTRGGDAVDLSPKAFLLLQTLIEAQPAAVSKETLYDHLWPQTFVEPGNLHNLISEIRTAIGDDDRTIVRTVHGFGYAFARQPPSSPEQSRFGVVVGDKFVRLRSGKNVIGRDPDAAIVLDAPDVSRRHACLLVANDTVTIEDLGSKNGTSLDGKPVRQREPVSAGAEIAVGDTVLVLRLLRDPARTVTSR
ncbi:MAG TPA: FHA domain-containing protein [Thermoanaerobaculia bacterium]|nr:FHA domain-containing protein [Thermoanaerobaculia bacterium]